MKVEQSLMAIERYISRCWREHSSEDPSLTYTEYDYLETLEELEAMRLSQLAALMHVSKPTASNMVSRLEKKQLVQRKPCPEDGRAIIVSLSPKGQKLVDSDRLLYKELVSKLLKFIPEKDQKQLEQLLEKIAARTVQSNAP